MSWTPTFWIKREDFDKHVDKLKVFNVRPLPIANTDGVVIYAGECTSGYRDLDIILHYNGIPHVIMDGHGEGCDHCVSWGEQIYSYEETD